MKFTSEQITFVGGLIQEQVNNRVEQIVYHSATLPFSGINVVRTERALKTLANNEEDNYDDDHDSNGDN